MDGMGTWDLVEKMNELLGGTWGSEVSMLGEDDPSSIRDHRPATIISRAHSVTPHWDLSYLVEKKLIKLADRVIKVEQRRWMGGLALVRFTLAR